MGMGQGLGAAFEAIGEAILGASQRQYEMKRKKTEIDENTQRQKDIIDYTLGAREKSPLYQADIDLKKARADKLARGGGGGGGGAGAASVLKTAQGKNAFISAMTQADEETRSKYLQNPTLALADPNFQTAFDSYVNKPGNKGGDKMAQLGEALGVKAPAAGAPAVAAATPPTKRPPLSAFYK